MPKYVLTYSGGHGRPETEEEQAQAMKAWEEWFAGLGSAVLDGGNPIGPSRTLAPGGEVSDGSRVNGYSLIEADDLDAAVAMAKDCPMLDNDGTVEVGEALEM